MSLHSTNNLIQSMAKLGVFDHQKFTKKIGGKIFLFESRHCCVKIVEILMFTSKKTRNCKPLDIKTWVLIIPNWPNQLFKSPFASKKIKAELRASIFFRW